MRFSLQREAFLKPLAQVVNVVERRQTLPVLANLLVQVRDGQLSLTGTDLEGAPVHVDGEDVLAGEQPFEVLCARELGQRFVEAALAEAQHAAGVLEHDLGPPIGCRV